MVANSSLKELKSASQTKSRGSDESISSFLRENPSRVLIVDFLNVMIGGAFGTHDIFELCEALITLYPMTPMIIVTKKVADWPSVDSSIAEDVTAANPNILIIICDARGSTSKVPISDTCFPRDAHGEYHKTNPPPLAQADDHMITLLTLSISSVGCGPMILSDDRYRNSGSVFKTIPSYEYTSYKSGIASAHWMDTKQTFNWIVSLGLEIAAHRLKCKHALFWRCKNCRRKDTCTCIWCGVCTECNINLLTSFHSCRT
jgi:hypothetical protein